MENPAIQKANEKNLKKKFYVRRVEIAVTLTIDIDLDGSAFPEPDNLQLRSSVTTGLARGKQLDKIVLHAFPFPSWHFLLFLSLFDLLYLQFDLIYRLSNI